ncbi:butyrate kinase [Ilyobacter polytropus]|uniref:Probable butyrate kinase n=1 Tax=Ilyobacter polytropus (strain ATCC 51220 / DSM 2926 / LMG 16218 / CuHBu1) TaxID=572544 RepID=E3H964_ILYPC|nr:butyrate kinase [Ilyobacter polytropus]ADO82763.1 butyrate kinase [Ilyobacter polytropus DSM 2926]
MKKFKILAINPGSTSTKISVFENDDEIFTETIRHSSDDIQQFKRIINQFEFRKKIIEKVLDENNLLNEGLHAVVGRGGLLRPLSGGTYLIEDAILRDLRVGVSGEHASNLGGIIAYEIGKDFHIPSYIVDPVVVDELEPVARISGIPEIERKSIFHALNQKAVARSYAKEIGKPYESLNLIVVHMGGGITIGSHKNGRVIDVTNALDGEGPLSSERSGALPVGDIIKMCFEKKYNEDFLKKRMVGKGGAVAYLRTNSIIEVLNLIEKGDKKAKLIFDAMIYQISKEIGAFSTVLKGNVDTIILTGGMAYSEKIIDLIKERVDFIAPIKVYPGEHEMSALAQGALRILKKEEIPLIYNPD